MTWLTLTIIGQAWLMASLFLRNETQRNFALGLAITWTAGGLLTAIATIITELAQ